jgi:predicted RNA-binding Zn-ribbon protein involved in translation (DUF1610 family)
MIPQPLKIRCAVPDCGYEWLRPRCGVLRADGTFVRTYVCPQCGEKVVIERKVPSAPVFDLRSRNVVKR